MMSPAERDQIELLCKRITVEKDPQIFGQLVKQLNDLLELMQIPPKDAGTDQHMCSVCNEPLQLESATTSECGQVVHEACYFAKISAIVSPKSILERQAAYNPYTILASSPRIPELLDLMIEATGADFGNVQLLDCSRRRLKIVAHQGFGRKFLSYFDTVCGGSFSCGAAMNERRGVVVSDIFHDPLFRDAQTHAVMLQANVRACQSTPLFDRSGIFIGVVSTHFRQPTLLNPLPWKRVDSLTADFTMGLSVNVAERDLRTN